MTAAGRSGPAAVAAVLALTLALLAGGGTGRALVHAPGVSYAEPAAGLTDGPAGVSAASYVVVEGATGQRLAAHRADQPRPVASTVKMLTALTALAHADPDDVVVVGSAVSSAGGAGTGLVPGDRLTVRELLELMIVRSGNDAALALAAGVAGSVETFVERMRRQAAGLGLRGIVLRTPTGLADANRLAAADLARIARAFLDDPLLAGIAGMREVAVPGVGLAATRNRLLEDYAGATGVKTGYTEVAGWSLVASAERRGREVVAVVLGARSDAQRFLDAQRLLDHAFDSTRVVSVGLTRRLRAPGRWIGQRVGPVAVTVPTRAGPARVVVAIPVALDGEADPAAVRTRDGTTLATVPLAWSGRPDDPPESPGAALMGAAYRAMRAAVRDGLWGRPG